MTDDRFPPLPERSPTNVAFFVILVAIAGFVIIGPFIGLAIAYPFYDGSPMDYVKDLGNPMGKESMKTILMIVQGCTTLFGLAIIPPLAWKAYTKRPVKELFDGNQVKPIHFLMIAGIVITYMGLLSVVSEWNANIDLPDGAFETWAKSTEKQLAELTKFLTTFSNVGQYLVGVLVISIFAGFGEEIVFRGLLQSSLQKSFRNIHVAIWVSAIFFSAFHLQFYGFVPRMMLGAVFGYLYYWSGNLFIPIFAHSLNNFLALSSIYLGYSKLPGMELENPEQAPWYVVAIMTSICAALLYFFYKQFHKTNDNRA